jgi:hypothetical protein
MSIQRLPTVHAFPALQCLACTASNSDGGELSNSIELSLAQQLEGLQLHGENGWYLTSSTLSMPVPILITVDEMDLDDPVVLPPPGFQHLRF